MNKGTLILICGLPGAGKTTLAKNLASERKAIRFCPDEWILALLKNQADSVERSRLRDPVEQLLWKETQILLKLGVTVILENGFWVEKERSIYRDIGKNSGARVEKRNSNPKEFQVTKKELEDGYKIFQLPTEEESMSYDNFFSK